ncbi:MAG TPA: hypothetical protein VG184_01135 [Acidimicrobiales bacterium]|jgi:hypothetical protein|nr:hypothetical protein [Acidimicrobiales bacterium]
MSLSDILDSSFRLWRANLRTISIIIATLVVPVQLVAALASRSILNGNSVVTVFNNASDGIQTPIQTNGAQTVASSISSIASFLILPFAAGAISRVVAGCYLGIDVSARDALKAAGRRWWALLLAWLLVHLIEGLGLILVVLPGLLVMALSVSVAPAIVMERLGPIKGIRRSWRLDRRRVWGIIGIAVLTGLVFSITAGVVSVPLELIAFAIGLQWGWILLFAASVVSSLISLPLNAIVATLVYFDGRIRNEGFDLQTLSLRLNR